MRNPPAAASAGRNGSGLSIGGPGVCWHKPKEHAEEERLRSTIRRGGLAALTLLLGFAPAFGQGTPRPWIDQSLLAAAKAEGSLIVYSSTNEQEGLPLFKIFEEATGIKVQYVRAADAPLMARVAV